MSDLHDHDLTALMTRRHATAWVTVGLGAVVAGLIGVPLVGFLLAPFFRRTPQVWRDVGPQEQFRVGQTVKVAFEDTSPLPWSGVTARTAAWLRRVSDTEFQAFAINCTHLGCPVRWMADANLFMCPCHGGVYYADGKVAAGPPPRPLVRYEVRVQDGRVQVQTAPIPIT